MKALEGVLIVTTLFDSQLSGREFSSHLLYVPDLLAWTKSKHLQLRTMPPIDSYEFVQVESLLCAIERNAGDLTTEQAFEIVANDPALQNECAAGDPATSRWLLGAEAHKKWRELLTCAIAAKELTLLDFGSKLPIGGVPNNNTATATPVKDIGSPYGSINLEQVNQAFFQARFWIGRARIRQAVTPVELLALLIEYHHHGDKNEFVIETYQALRNAINRGFIAARSNSMMPLPSLPANDEWIVTVHDAEQFFQSIGLGWSVKKAIEDVFNECVPKAPESQTATPSPAPLVAGGASMIHSTKTRRDALTPVIEFAQKQCRNSQDDAEVWATLLVLAEKKHAPLIGCTEAGLQYLKNGTTGYLSRGALKKRLDR